VFSLFFVIISLIIFFLPQLLSHLSLDNRRISPLEAGFRRVRETSSGAFSVQFFLLIIIFVVFDLEIIVLFGVILQKSIFLILFLFSFIIFTLWLEWGIKKLRWVV